MDVYTVIIFQKAQHIACKLYIVRVSRRPQGTQSCIPRRWSIDTLRKNQNEASLVCLCPHVRILSHVPCCDTVCVVVNDQWLRLSPICGGQVDEKCTFQPARGNRCVAIARYMLRSPAGDWWLAADLHTSC